MLATGSNRVASGGTLLNVLRTRFPVRWMAPPKSGSSGVGEQMGVPDVALGSVLDRGADGGRKARSAMVL